MINLEVKTTLSIPEVCSRLKLFFGKELGLKIVDDSPSCLSFEGSGGYVNAIVCKEGDQTNLNLKAMEWEAQVKKFASHLP